MNKIIKTLVPFTLVVVVFSNLADAKTIPYLCKSNDRRYAIRVTETADSKPQIVLLREKDSQGVLVPVESFHDEYLKTFQRSTTSIYAVGESSKTEIRLIADPLLIGTTDLDGEGNEKWKGRVYLNPKLTSIIEGLDDAHPVKSPDDVLCETEF